MSDEELLNNVVNRIRAVLSGPVDIDRALACGTFLVQLQISESLAKLASDKPVAGRG